VRVLRLAGPRGSWLSEPTGAPGSGEADVWLFRPSSPAARAHTGRLSEDERERAQRLRRSEQRLRFSAVRGTLRTILSRYLDIAPHEIPIAYGPQGKPHVAPEAHSSLRFNVSHSGALAAIAVTRHGEIGVDVELRVPRPRLPLLAEALLAQSERPWFEGLDPRDRTRAFFDLWSAKEACSKLIGRGMAMPFSAIALASPETDVSQVSVTHPSATKAARFVRRLPLDAGYSGALAVEVVGPPHRIPPAAGPSAAEQEGTIG
jgi:4'-phosphopantetheinyl transferase